MDEGSHVSFGFLRSWVLPSELKGIGHGDDSQWLPSPLIRTSSDSTSEEQPTRDFLGTVQDEKSSLLDAEPPVHCNLEITVQQDENKSSHPSFGFLSFRWMLPSELKGIGHGEDEWLPLSLTRTSSDSASDGQSTRDSGGTVQDEKSSLLDAEPPVHCHLEITVQQDENEISHLSFDFLKSWMLPSELKGIGHGDDGQWLPPPLTRTSSDSTSEGQFIRDSVQTHRTSSDSTSDGQSPSMRFLSSWMLPSELKGIGQGDDVQWLPLTLTRTSSGSTSEGQSTRDSVQFSRTSSDSTSDGQFTRDSLGTVQDEKSSLLDAERPVHCNLETTVQQDEN
ncbi:unnamed protein product, partial [Polarella glacialis]